MKSDDHGAETQNQRFLLGIKSVSSSKHTLFSTIQNHFSIFLSISDLFLSIFQLLIIFLAEKKGKQKFPFDKKDKTKINK